MDPKDLETKNRIIKGAEELFFKHGIRSITMDDIAKHLSMSKKTIYNFFKEKEEVVYTLMEMKIKEDQENFASIHESNINIVEEVFYMLKQMSEMFSSINPNVFYDLQKFYPKSWHLFTEFKEKCIVKMVEKSINKGKEDGLVRDDVNAKILARLRMEEIEMCFNSKVFAPDKFSILDTQLALAEHFLYGICTLKGHKLINKHKQITEDE